MYSMPALTETETAVLSFVSKYQQAMKVPPTMAEIQVHCPRLKWRSSVRYVLVSLVMKGMLAYIAPTKYSRRYGVRSE